MMWRSTSGIVVNKAKQRAKKLDSKVVVIVAKKFPDMGTMVVALQQCQQGLQAFQHEVQLFGNMPAVQDGNALLQLQQEVHTVRGQVHTVQGQINGIQGQVNVIQQQVQPLQGLIQNLPNIIHKDFSKQYS
jgi:prophage DNA circulation protein